MLVLSETYTLVQEKFVFSNNIWVKTHFHHNQPRVNKFKEKNLKQFSCPPTTTIITKIVQLWKTWQRDNIDRRCASHIVVIRWPRLQDPCTVAIVLHARKHQLTLQSAHSRCPGACGKQTAHREQDEHDADRSHPNSASVPSKCPPKVHSLWENHSTCSDVFVFSCGASSHRFSTKLGIAQDDELALDSCC